jgi:VWFA-related protein
MTSISSRLFWKALGVLAATSTLVLAQQQPTFRSRVDIVQVDVTVLDDQRRPVRGLMPTDFTLFEDGRPQEIVAFTEMSASEPWAPADSWIRKVPPDVKVNNAEDGRLLLLILDDARTPVFAAHRRGGEAIGPNPKEAVKQAARAIVDRLGPNDLASVIFTLKTKNEQEFTNDRERLFAAIDGFSQLPDVEGSYNQMVALSTYGEAARVLGSIPHRRKAIVLISVAAPLVIPLELHPAYVVPMPTSSDKGPSSNPVQIAGLAQDALRWAFRGNVTFYNVNPMRLNNLEPEIARMLGPDADAAATAAAPRFGQPTSGLPPPPKYYDAYENRVIGAPLDELTGGFSIRSTDEFAAGVTQIFRESGSYYLLGYSSPNVKDDGKLRRIEVKLKSLAHVVRSRSAFVPPKNERERPPSSPLWGAISGITPAKDVAMRVNALPFAKPQGNGTALVITLGLRQPVDVGIGPGVQETVRFLTQAFTPSGQKRGSPRFLTVNFDMKPNAGGEVRYEVLSWLDLGPGRYHIRLSAESTVLGKSGSIYADVEIPDFSKLPVSLSGVVISSTPQLSSGPRESLRWLLPVVPTSQREFSGHQGAAYFRVYQGGRKPLIPVGLTTRILDLDNRVLFESSETVEVDRFNRQQRAAEHTFALPIDSLGPGAYLLTFRVAAGDGPTASRDVRFTISASTVR